MARLRQARQKLNAAPSERLVPRRAQQQNGATRKDNFQYTQTQDPQRLKLTETSIEAAAHAAEKLRAIRASMMILWVVLPTYAFQFFLWIFGFIAIALETVPGVDFILPGAETYVVTYGLIGCMGILSMLYAAFVFTVHRVRWFGGNRGLAFAFCTALYLVFFLNLFPWVLVFLLIVIFSKREGEVSS